MKGIGIIKKLSNVFPKKSLITIYKSFVSPHLDYGDLIHDQPNNESFRQQTESLQYNVSIAITGTIKGTSRHLDFVPFTKLKVLVSLHTCLTLFQKAVSCTILAQYSSIRFFRLQYQDGIN